MAIASDRETARRGGPALNVITHEALSYADCIANCVGAGWSVAALARDFGVEKPVIEWWLAISKLKPPHWEGELFYLADRGALAVEIADRFGFSVTVARSILYPYRTELRAEKKAAAWQYAQVYG
jgi:hypothetical protein